MMIVVIKSCGITLHNVFLYYQTTPPHLYSHDFYLRRSSKQVLTHIYLQKYVLYMVYSQKPWEISLDHELGSTNVGGAASTPNMINFYQSFECFVIKLHNFKQPSNS